LLGNIHTLTDTNITIQGDNSKTRAAWWQE